MKVEYPFIQYFEYNDKHLLFFQCILMLPNMVLMFR